MDYFHQDLKLRISNFESKYQKKGLSPSKYQQGLWKTCWDDLLASNQVDVTWKE